jgi:hypothetical protein
MAMNTLPLGVRPANPVHALIAQIQAGPRRAENDNGVVRCWTDDPRAKLLLASCAERPPFGEWKRQTFGFSTDRWFEYVGYRVEALAAIHMKHGERVHADYMARGEAAYSAFAAWCRSPSVTDAINLVLSATLDAVREG